MFGKKPSASALADEFDRAVETIAALLRTYGTYALDTEAADAANVRERCEALAHQIVYTAAGARRDFGAARHFFTDQRRRESEALRRTLGDLRHVLWLFIHLVGRSVADDHERDRATRAHMERLKSALDSHSTADLKREAAAMVALLTEHMAVGAGQQRAIRDLGARLHPLQGELARGAAGGAEEAARQMDPLTRLHSRGSFEEHLARTAELDALMGRGSSLLLIDVDRLGAANAAAGRAGGDELLLQVGRCLVRHFCRREDYVARLEGGEFGVVAPEGAERVRGVAQRVLAAARELHVEPRGQRLSCTLSIGLSEHRPAERQAPWVARTRAQLQRAKQRGGDTLAADEGAPV